MVSIPASVALLAALLGLIDQFIDDTVADVDANRLQRLLPSILVIAFVAAGVLGAALITHTTVIKAFAGVFVCIVLLHLAWYYLLRSSLVGVARHRLEPPHRPVQLPDDEEDETEGPHAA